jgi:ribose 5-phosphate isomerase B
MRLEEMIPVITKNVLDRDDNIGILSCGTGVGVEVGANKFSGIRACLATNEKIAGWSRIYDKCNILCLAGWDCNKDQVNKILDAWFKSEYDGSEKRLKMFEEFNKWR